MLRTALRHDRALVVAALGVVIVLAWVWLLLGAGMEMGQPTTPPANMNMPNMTMPSMNMPSMNTPGMSASGSLAMNSGGNPLMRARMPWTASHAALMFVMWAVMMAAMMLPSAAPTILLVDALDRKASRGGLGTGLFTLGYLVVWIGFSLLATALQFALDHAGLLREDFASASTRLAAAFLIVAGIYEWTPLKHACLTHCRAPLEFLIHHWRNGPLHAGLRHGVYCLGCCWLLMALLFVGGLMNLIWIAALALLVLVEKLMPFGGRTSRIAGLAMIAWGVFRIADRL